MTIRVVDHNVFIKRYDEYIPHNFMETMNNLVTLGIFCVGALKVLYPRDGKLLIRTAVWEKQRIRDDRRQSTTINLANFPKNVYCSQCLGGGDEAGGLGSRLVAMDSINEPQLREASL